MSVHVAEQEDADGEDEAPTESHIRVAEKERVARMLSNLQVPFDCLLLPFEPFLCLCPVNLPLSINPFTLTLSPASLWAVGLYPAPAEALRTEGLCCSQWLQCRTIMMTTWLHIAACMALVSIGIHCPRV